MFYVSYLFPLSIVTFKSILLLPETKSIIYKLWSIDSLQDVLYNLGNTAVFCNNCKWSTTFKNYFKKDLVIYLMRIIKLSQTYQNPHMCKYGSWSTLLQVTLQRGIQKGWRTNNSLNLPMMLSDCSSLFSLWFVCSLWWDEILESAYVLAWIYIQWCYRLLSACSPFFRILGSLLIRKARSSMTGSFAGFPNSCQHVFRNRKACLPSVMWFLAR